MLAGCATPDRALTTQPAMEWQPLLLPGKTATRYGWETKDGVRSIAAHADKSASIWERLVSGNGEMLGTVAFSWWIDDILADANVAEAGLTDAPARVMFAFDGDMSKLSARTRLQFELAQTLTGRAPPYAMLAYVWDAKAPVGTVIVHPRNDRLRKIVVESGAKHTKQWRKYRRNLKEDFKLAFGEAPGRMTSVALMTDSDNVGGVARAWYGDIVFDE
jgi:Protein of unknown function (DUF3047)